MTRAKAASVPENRATVSGSFAARTSSISTAAGELPGLGQAEGERTEPGSDLDDVRGVFEPGGGDDRPHGIGVDDEVLPLLLRWAQTDVSG